MKPFHVRSRTLPLAFVASLGGCLENDPVGVEFQDIETAQYHPSLEVDLSVMTVTSSGLYLVDNVVGTGDAVQLGSTVTVTFTAYLIDAFVWDEGTLADYVVGTGFLPIGFQDGLLGMRPGGQRRVIVPPELGYAAQNTVPNVPPGSILIFDQELISTEN